MVFRFALKIFFRESLIIYTPRDDDDEVQHTHATTRRFRNAALTTKNVRSLFSCEYIRKYKQTKQRRESHPAPVVFGIRNHQLGDIHAEIHRQERVFGEEGKGGDCEFGGRCGKQRVFARRRCEREEGEEEFRDEYRFNPVGERDEREERHDAAADEKGGRGFEFYHELVEEEQEK